VSVTISSQARRQPARIAGYIREMFPPLVSVLAALMHFAAVYFGAQALEGHTPLRLTWRGAAGALSVILFFLLMRVYDELKDVETDLRLGRAGDPRYKDRAIVTGRIQVSDLRVLRWTVTGLLIAVNIPSGFPVPLAVFAVAFFLTWCSFHWFFWPPMSRYLLVAFVTHNPLVMVVAVYVASIAIRDFGLFGRTGELAALIVGLWATMAAWEISRKIRAVQDETAYTTYSKVLGWRLAGVLPLFFVLVSAACFVFVGASLALPRLYAAFVIAAVLLVATICGRFERRPNTKTANIRPYVEAFSFIAVTGFCVFLMVRFGFSLY
jgi:4-hydroxybenzoate polyprenyltransferase